MRLIPRRGRTLSRTVLMPLPIPGEYATQPWNRVVWPGEVVGAEVFGPASASSIPAVGRALGILCGLASQMPLDRYRGTTRLSRGLILDVIDPAETRPYVIAGLVEDYLLHGNACLYELGYDSEGWPLAASWLPAGTVTVVDLGDGEIEWRRGDRVLDSSRIIQIKRGQDRGAWWRGVGVVEQHLDALGRVAREDAYQGGQLATGAVPSVAIIAPHPDLTSEEAQAAGDEFLTRYGGTIRRPGVFPHGTEVKPLAWSPSDSQLVEARTLSLTDVANMMNLDAYFLGAPGSSHTYRSPGPMFLALLRTSLEPILCAIEEKLSQALVPRGQRVRFDRSPVLRDDLGMTVEMLTKATAPTADGRPLMSWEEAREYLHLPTDGILPTVTTPAPVAEGSE